MTSAKSWTEGDGEARRIARRFASFLLSRRGRRIFAFEAGEIWIGDRHNQLDRYN